MPGTRTFGKGGYATSELFSDPQPRRPCSGVCRHLLFGRADWTAGDGAKGCPVAAGADWLLGWADAVFGLDVEE